MKIYRFVFLLIFAGSVFASWMSDRSSVDSLRVIFDRTCEDSASFGRFLKQKEIIEDLEVLFNEELDVKTRVTIDFSCAKGGGPYYLPSGKKIVIPISFRGYLEKLIKHSEMAKVYNFTEDDIEEISNNTMIFMIFHELGHALIDVLDIPTTGREEDAVDELSTILLLSYYEDGIEMALSAAVVFNVWSEMQDATISDDRMYGEHSLDAQRFFNILCMVYGYDDSANGDVFNLFEVEVSDERAYRCILDYNKKARSWYFLLKPHLRDQEES